MKLSFNFELGRSKTQKRALNAEMSTTDKDAAIKSLPITIVTRSANRCA